MRSLCYPTPEHADAAAAVVEFFTGRGGVKAVLLTCSCARGRATPDSCVDISVLLASDLPVEDRRSLERDWTREYESNRVYQRLAGVGQYSHVDLDFTDGIFKEPSHGWTSGPDDFEVDIGNLLVYSVPLLECGARLGDLKREWLPYYGDDLRQRRRQIVTRCCVNNLRHVPLFAKRELHFQAFKRFYNALGGFLQSLFISKRVYPIAYDKWVKEQLVEILGLPEVYQTLVDLMTMRRFESDELVGKASSLEEMLRHYCENAGG